MRSISGTHLCDTEAPNFIIPGFEFSNHSCSEDSVPQICGGVAIFVRTGAAAVLQMLGFISGS